MSLTWGASSLDLSRAKLCMNCETISDATGERCPKCAAIANWLTLSTVLSEDRDRQESDRLARAVIAERERKIHAFRKDGAA
jgi:RNA polymerase subunit RPABC4/transcription elongation factor Spt4